MELDEVLEALDDAIEAMREYDEPRRLREESIEGKIKKMIDDKKKRDRVSELLTESAKFVSNPSGTTCPMCDGSGTV
jgi:hypothetical protein